MHIEKDSVSEKNASVAGLLGLFFGTLGLHRVYVGKYKSGLIYLFFGSSLFGVRICKELGLFFGLLGGVKGVMLGVFLFLIVACAVLYDLFALYSETFLDKDGKILLSNSRKDELVGRSSEEKFINSIENLSVVLLFIAFWICYALFFRYVI